MNDGSCDRSQYGPSTLNMSCVQSVILADRSSLEDPHYWQILIVRSLRQLAMLRKETGQSAQDRGWKDHQNGRKTFGADVAGRFFDSFLWTLEQFRLARSK